MRYAASCEMLQSCRQRSLDVVSRPELAVTVGSYLRKTCRIGSNTSPCDMVRLAATATQYDERRRLCAGITIVAQVLVPLEAVRNNTMTCAKRTCRLDDRAVLANQELSQSSSRCRPRLPLAFFRYLNTGSAVEYRQSGSGSGLGSVSGSGLGLGLGSVEHQIGCRAQACHISISQRFPLMHSHTITTTRTGAVRDHLSVR